MNVILSIRPNFCKLIFSGQKMYEYRKRVFTRSDIDRVYVYASKPICRIVGYFTIDEVIKDTPSNIWANTHKDGGITKEYFDAYFKGCHTAHAIKIDEVVKLEKPINPKTVITDFIAPQNFTYTDISF